jgi:hypothetical protein
VLVWLGIVPSCLLQQDGDDMSKLKLIDERLKSLRATRQNKARDAEWCKDNRWRDEFKMDRERHHHLSTVALLDREIADLEQARRCELPVGGSVGHGEWRPATPGFVGSDH